MTFHSRARISFFTILFSGFGIISVLVFYVFSVWDDVSAFFSSLLGQSPQCDCAYFLSFQAHPFFHTIFLFSFVIAVVIILTFFFFVFAQLRKMRFIEHYVQEHRSSVPAHLISFLEENGIRNRLTLIDDDHVRLFCMGLFRPQIILSSHALRLMDFSEIRASLLHEKHHLLSRDPFKFFVCEVFAQIFSWLPGWFFLTGQFKMYAEFAADEFSLSRGLPRASLASALLKCLDALAFSASLPTLSEHYELRLNYLLVSQKPPLFFLRRLLAVFTAVFLILFSVIFSDGYAVLAAVHPPENRQSYQCALLKSNTGLFSPATPMSLTSNNMSEETEHLCR